MGASQQGPAVTAHAQGGVLEGGSGSMGVQATLAALTKWIDVLEQQPLETSVAMGGVMFELRAKLKP